MRPCGLTPSGAHRARYWSAVPADADGAPLEEVASYLQNVTGVLTALRGDNGALLGYTMANYGLGYYAPPAFVPE